MSAIEAAAKRGTLLVTGGGGFLGAAVALHWSRAGGRAIGLVRAGRASIEAVETHVTDYAPDHLARLIDETAPIALVHAAGTASVAASLADPAGDFAGSVALSQAVFEGVRRSRRSPPVVYLSSAAVYGSPEEMPIAEEAPLRPVSPYGHHKMMVELLAREYASCFGLRTRALRLFSIFGAGQRRLLLWELFGQFAKQERVRVLGTGDEIRDYMHVDDVAAAVIALLPGGEEGGFDAVNVASGRAVTVRALAELVKASLGSAAEIVYGTEPRPGDPPRWVADIGRMRRLAGSVAAAPYPLEARVAETLRAWQQ
jgi:nucleoside-diphosphate-sugar epimerase